jgi:hypothetical protein
MPYINPFTRDNREHIVKIVSNVVPTHPVTTGKAVGTSVYQFKVVCSCQWEVLTKTEEEANQWKFSHEMRHSG